MTFYTTVVDIRFEAIILHTSIPSKLIPPNCPATLQQKLFMLISVLVSKFKFLLGSFSFLRIYFFPYTVTKLHPTSQCLYYFSPPKSPSKLFLMQFFDLIYFIFSLLNKMISILEKLMLFCYLFVLKKLLTPSLT